MVITFFTPQYCFDQPKVTVLLVLYKKHPGIQMIDLLIFKVLITINIILYHKKHT